MLANLACSVLEHGRIKTTEARAKEVRPMVEKMITMGKAGDLNSRRTAISQLRNKKISYKLFNEHARATRPRWCIWSWSDTDAAGLTRD